MILVGLGANLEFDGFSPVQNMEKVLADLGDHENYQTCDETRAFQGAPPFISMIAPWLSSGYNNARVQSFQEL